MYCKTQTVSQSSSSVVALHPVCYLPACIQEWTMHCYGRGLLMERIIYSA